MAGRTLPRADSAVFDFSSFTESVAETDLRAFKRVTRTQRDARRHRFVIARSSAVAFLLFVVVALCAVSIWGILSYTIANNLGSGFTVAVAILVVFLAFLIYGCVEIARKDLPRGARWARRYRLARFASRNGLEYVGESVGGRLPGSIFGLGKSGRFFEVMRVVSGRPVMFGNYRRDGMSLSNKERWQWGFLAIRLDRAMPHMVVEARSNRGPFTNRVGINLTRNQALSLEGDFDKHFTLYAPKQYEQDALYVFTPDLMALLIDRVSKWDIEIVDDWLFVYSHRPFDLTKQATHERLAEIVHTVAHKTVGQTHRYADARVGGPYANRVGLGGRRLVRGASAGVVVAVIYVILRVVASYHGS